MITSLSLPNVCLLLRTVYIVKKEEKEKERKKDVSIPSNIKGLFNLVLRLFLTNPDKFKRTKSLQT